MEKDKSTEKRMKDIEQVRPYFGPSSRFEREIERMFRSIGRIPRFRFGWPEELRQRWGLGAEFPLIEIYDEKDDIVVKAELPGMQKEELEINLADDVLTIKGEKKKEEEVKEKDYYFSERSYGSFERSVDIPKKVLPDKVKASFKDGVLEVRLQKSEPERKKEIKIKVE